MSNIVKKRGTNQHFSVVRGDNGRKTIIFAKLPKILQGIVIDSQSVLKTGVNCSRVGSGSKCQLSNLAQPLKFGRINNLANSVGERNVLLDRHAYHTRMTA